MNNEWNNNGEDERNSYNGEENNSYGNDFGSKNTYGSYNNSNRGGSDYYGGNGQNGYGNQNQNPNDYAFRTVMNNGRPKTMGWSVASMILGIVSVVCCCLGWSGIFLGIGAVVLSIVSRKSLGYFDGMSIAGLILGIFGFVFGISMVIAVYTSDVIINEDFYNEFWNEFYFPEEEGPGGNL